MTLTWRPATRADAPALTLLINAAIEADGTGWPIGPSAVVQQFDAPRFDPERHSITAWHDGDAVAAGTIWANDEPHEGRALLVLGGDVHPDHRGRGVGTELLRRLEEMAISLAAERLPGIPVRLRSQGGLTGSAAERLLEKHGYRPDNYFITMEVALAAWPDPGAPVDVVAPDPILLAATRDAHNDAFRDHRNFTPRPEDEWAYWMSGAENRPAISRVAVDDERVLAYAIVAEDHPGVAHFQIVGTRREARGRGLARAVLLGSLRAARDAGFEIAELEVDSTSPTGADRLYTSVGFVPVRTISRYQRDVS
jgi:mycothiol synthase